MRTAGIVGVGLSLCLALSGVTGCKSQEGPSKDPAAIKAQQELMARRNALIAEQKRLSDESKALELKIEEGKAKGDDVAELTKQKDALDQKLAGSESELNQAADQLSSISSKLDAAGGMATREAEVSQREARVAEREKELVARMERLMELDAQRADKWKEGCATAGAPTTTTIIQQVAAPKDGKYTRKEVDALVARAKAAMAKKGLINADLGAQAGLEGEVLAAQQDSDWTRGYVLASQLAQTIDAIQINRPFIRAKYDRLQAKVKGAKLDEATQATLTDGMKEVMQKYGDGDFVSANRRINQLWSGVR